MISSNKNLLDQIESLRNKMAKVAMDKGYADTESVQLSQELDKLLNAYQNKQRKKPLQKLR